MTTEKLSTLFKALIALFGLFSKNFAVDLFLFIFREQY